MRKDCCGNSAKIYGGNNGETDCGTTVISTSRMQRKWCGKIREHGGHSADKMRAVYSRSLVPRPSSAVLVVLGSRLGSSNLRQKHH